MGIDELRAQLAQASTDCTDLAGTLTAAGQQAETTLATLSGMLQSTSDAEAHEALGALARLQEQVRESVGLIGIAQQAVESYGARL